MENRCAWCGSEPLYTAYHDEEWGVPVHDDRLLFEQLVLQGAQAGLSWLTILRKRENYRKVFNAFDYQKIAAYEQEEDINRLLNDSGIVRNRLKIASVVNNARRVLAVKEEFGTLDDFLWSLVDGRTIQNNWKTLAELPAWTEKSRAMSRDLKRRGFTFVGPTSCYAFMQAVGMVNDHTRDCFRYGELGGAA